MSALQPLVGNPFDAKCMSTAIQTACPALPEASRISLVEYLLEDWRVHGRNLLSRGLWVLAVHRFGCWRYGIRWRPARWPFSALYKLLFLMVQILTNVEFPCEARVGRRLRIEHVGDIVISGDASFGDDVILRNGTTIGLKTTNRRGSPQLGNRVDIGAGAKLLGPIIIGDDAVIGANAVVLRDVPAGHLAVGVPARILRRQRETIVTEGESK